ncbi:Translin [Suhomyces tanzawaensis NRRL Y-17324]|uniref:Translin n=1 Tax=Suhomyces tanzawaensis NRRL Y-17324 TaxID=984487 RepID=A0A1E4SM15_9ASCO|nr:Translin [Suhomyces tanzawaensis NRRL Y-17324]ODV80528.1 Translin [Suhomyces tanzawaensis NRRL Y-17324]
MESYQAQIFKPARSFLLQYHDERETVIRICRDLNSYSKKLIFTFHRVSNRAISDVHYDQIIEYIKVIGKCLSRLSKEFVSSVNFGQLKSSISNAAEEMIEAFTFMYYVMTRNLLKYEQMLKFIEDIVEEEDTKMVLEKFWRSEEELQMKNDYTFIYRGDYFMGLFDLTGEIMRYTISNLVDDDTKTLSKESLYNLQFMESLYKQMREILDTYPNLNVNRGVLSDDFHSKGVFTMKKKLEVFKDSLSKVELTICETVIRTREEWDVTEL